MQSVFSLSDLVPRYKHLFVDVYGVLHDGGVVFPYAAEALRSARRHGAHVVIVTNSAGRIDVVRERLTSAGLQYDCYDALISSGELAWSHLNGRSCPSGSVGRLRVVQETDWPAWLHDLPHPRVGHADDADAIVAAGMPFRTEDAYASSRFEEELGAALRRALPMIVADSDESYPSRGTIRLGPGWLARRYRALGGMTIEFGKPHRPIYERAFELAGRPEPESVLMIGDNLATDIAGAKAAGIDSMLVRMHGVHKGQTERRIRAQARSVGALPTWMMPQLRWAA